MKDEPPSTMGTEEPCPQNEIPVNFERRSVLDRRQSKRNLEPRTTSWQYGKWISMFDDIKSDEQ